MWNARRAMTSFAGLHTASHARVANRFMRVPRLAADDCSSGNTQRHNRAAAGRQCDPMGGLEK